MGKGKQPQLSRGQRFEILEKKVKQMEMSTQVFQMLIQQLTSNMKPMQHDLTETINSQREVQYRVLAIQELLELNKDTINAKAEELQIRDFNESSDKEDLELNYTLTDVVAEDSAVIITSTTPEEKEDRGVMRSKLVMANIGFPDLKNGLMGKKVGDILELPLQNVKHRIEILGIRTVPAPVEPEEPKCNCTEGEKCTDECTCEENCECEKQEPKLEVVTEQPSV